ncbi:MAG: hypothetical protein ACO26Z_04240 [Candidatus Nanopelagicaceae bacterium]|jgi:F0F1-type ATP synthase assembly protein I
MAQERDGSDSSRGQSRGEESALWSIFGYLISGQIVWGGIGWGLDQWLGTSFLVLVGLLLGMGSSIYLVWLRFGRK